MNRKLLYALWGGLFILCAGLGFIPGATGVWKGLMTVLSVLFFAPPALLLKGGNGDDRVLVRNLAALSLTVTVLVLILNFVLAMGSNFLGNVLHFLLAVVSAPMMTMGSWAASLFLWACLLIASLKK